MSLDKQTSLKAMRTLARDVAREQGPSDQPDAIEPEVSTEASNQPTPVMADDKHDDVTQKPAPKPAKKKEEKKATAKKSKEQKKVVEKKDKKKSEPKRVPAFHEIQKTVNEHIDAKEAKQKPEKTTSKKKGITPTKAVSGGTIITDTKKDKGSFFAELSKSMTNWFNELKRSFTPKKKTSYTVSKTERRKGIVQKATSKSGTIFTADNETLKEQIKAKHRKEQLSDDDEDILWSPYTETGYALLEGEAESSDPRVENVSVAFKKRAVAVPAKPTPAPKPVIKSTEESLAELPEMTIPEPEPTPEPPQPAKPEPVEPPPPVEPEPLEVIPEIEDDNEEADLQKEERKWDISSASPTDTNTQSLIAVVSLVILGVLAFGAYVFFQTFTTEPESTPTATVLVPEASQENITVANGTFNELLTKTNSTLLAKPAGLYEFTYVAENGRTVPGTVLTEILMTNEVNGFVTTVDTARFISNGSSRAFLFTVSDTLNARGALLDWEDTMLADLGRLLNTESVPLSAGEFTDSQIGNNDLRALVFDGQTILVYSFITEDRVVITNDISLIISLDID